MIRHIKNWLSRISDTDRNDAGPFHPSQKCPECGSPLMLRRDQLRRDELRASPNTSIREEAPESSKDLFRDSHSSSLAEEGWQCPNLDCPALIRSRLEHWCSGEVMNITGVTPALISAIVSRGLARDVAELYRIKLKELAALPGMDSGLAREIFDALTASLKAEAWRVLFGLGIPHLRASEASSLCAHFGSVDNVLAASGDRLAKVPDVTLQTASSVTHWTSDPVNRRLVKRLYKSGLNFKA